LVIETVDFEKTIASLKRKDTDPERINIKNWLFGMEWEGMVHKYCFDKVELIQLLESIGFRIKKSSHKVFRKTQAILRIEATKEASESLDIVSEFTSSLIDKHLVDFKKSEESLFDIEELINKIKCILCKSKLNEAIILELLKEIAVYNPLLSKTFFEILLKNNSYPGLYDKIQKAIQISENLIYDRFPAFLAYLFYKTPQTIGQQETLYHLVTEKAKEYIDAKFNNVPKEQVLPLRLLLWPKAKLQSRFYKFTSFSLLDLRNESKKMVAQGIKHFAQESFYNANKFLAESLKFNRKNLFAYWNLARLYLTKDNIPQAIIQYQSAFSVVPPFYQQSLQNEIRDVIRFNKENKYKEPKEYVLY